MACILNGFFDSFGARFVYKDVACLFAGISNEWHFAKSLFHHPLKVAVQIAVNRTGHEPDPSGQTNGISFWGSSFVAGPQGELLYRAPKDEAVNAVIEVDMQRSENVRRWWPFLRDRRIEEFGPLAKRFID